MKRFALIWILVFVALLTSGNVALAGKPGRSNLYVRMAGTTGFSNEPINVNLGEEVNIELFIEGRDEQLTGVDIFLEFDDTYLLLLPARSNPLNPFLRGTNLGGTVLKNSTLGDTPGGGGNQFSFFQLQYNEDITPSIGGGQRFAVGDGVIATFRVRVIKKPTGLTTGVRVIRTAPSGSETGYYKLGDAGSIYNFSSIKELQLNIRGLELNVNLPDLYLRPGQVDSSLDLDDYVDDVANPDSTLTWTNAVPVPDSIQVGINPRSHRVVVDPRIISGQDTVNFIGISQVRFTATTRFDETISDVIRVVVDSPPVLVDSAIVKTLTYFEDRDTTLTLVAIDPDPGARLTFATIAQSENITATMGTQTVKGDTIFQVVRMSSAKDFNGTGQVTFSVTDQFSLADTVAVQVVVRPVNDPPRFKKPFPEVVLDAFGQSRLTLSEYVEDIDDPFTRLQFSFSGVDSIAFDVTSNNVQLIVTSVPPFQGTRTANVVVSDTSNAVAIQKIDVRVTPPKDPQKPQISVEEIKVNIRAGDVASVVNLDTLVNDIDTADDLLKWTRGPVSRFVVDAAALNNRQLSVSAAADSIGYRTMELRVVDPNQLADTLLVRMYASSVATGIPVVGGLPENITLISGQKDTLNLDSFYFDADNSNSEVTWTATGAQNVIVTIDPNSHVAILEGVTGGTGGVDDLVFTVTDPQGKTASGTVGVSVLNPGSVALDISVLGGKFDLVQNTPDTLSLRQLVRVGNPDSIAWGVNLRNSSLVFAQLFGEDVLMIGLGIGNTHIVLTATDKNSGKSAQDSLLVSVGKPGGGPVASDTVRVNDFGALNLTAGRDTTLDLTTVVTAGNLANLVWSVGPNDNVAVEIDTLNQRALVRASESFFGTAGDLVFLVRDIVTGLTATSVASPVVVAPGGPIGTDLIKIEVVRNPVLKNFLDVFVRARRGLQSNPIMDVRIGEDPSIPRTVIPVDPVALVSGMWVGDLRLGNATTGLVEITALGISQETRIALFDTLRLRIEQANVRSTFNLSQDQVSVSLPAGGVNAPSVVALIPERRETTRTKLATSDLVPASDTYMVYAPDAEVMRSGEISFAIPHLPDQAGIYREDPNTGKWILVGRDIQDGRLVGEFDAFGRYGVFVDLNPISQFKLHQNFPNPFNPQTTIRFDLSEADDVQLIIYNALGQEVRHLVSGYMSSGRHVVTWDARDEWGQQVSAGVYVYQLKMSGTAITRKMVLLK